MIESIAGPELVALIALSGLMIGSFLNVVIHRLPIMIERDDTADGGARYDLAWPPSACPDCGRRLPPWENVPVLSFLWLRGRCRGCGARISWRYPLVEIASAILPAFLALAAPDPVRACGLAVFGWFSVAIAVIDIDRRLIPDLLSLGLMWAGLCLAAAGWGAVTADSAILGAAIGYVGLRGVEWAAERWYGRPALGAGDVKLLAAIGAWVGPAGLAPALVIASGTGAAVGLALIAVKRLDRDHPIPFGPFLCLGGLATLVFG